MKFCILGKEITSSDVKRFWGKVDVRSPDECWDWTASRVNGRYGRLGIQGKLVLAHRVAYTLVYGTIPESDAPGGSVIMHSCDRPVCCNPFHLSLGTQSINMADSSAKGRMASLCGESSPIAKLTNSVVLEIRERYALGGITQPQLAAEYGIALSHINRVLLRQVWSHI